MGRHTSQGWQRGRSLHCWHLPWGSAEGHVPLMTSSNTSPILNTQCHLYESKLLLFSVTHVWLFATPWTAAGQASLSFTFSQSLFKLMSTESVVPSNHLVLCRPLLLLPSTLTTGSFPTGQLFTSGGQSIGVSALASVLPMNIQTWFPLGWTGWISLQSKGLSKVFSSTTVQKHQFFGTQSSLWSNSHIPTWLMEKLED